MKTEIANQEKQTLFSLVAQTNAITQKIIEAGGELTPELEQALTSVDLAVSEKVDGYSFVMERMESDAAFFKAKAAFYSKIAKSAETVQERLKSSIKQAIQDLGSKEVVGNNIRFVLSAVKPKMIIDEMKLSPDMKMQVTTTVPDKERIREALEGGIPIEGAHLEESTSLRVYPVKKG
jgi:hypothetical protein